MMSCKWEFSMELQCDKLGYQFRNHSSNTSEVKVDKTARKYSGGDRNYPRISFTQPTSVQGDTVGLWVLRMLYRCEWAFP